MENDFPASGQRNFPLSPTRCRLPGPYLMTATVGYRANPFLRDQQPPKTPNVTRSISFLYARADPVAQLKVSVKVAAPTLISIGLSAISHHESRLYTFSQETKEKLRKFRLGTSRAKDAQAMIYMIDNKSQEIKPASSDVYSDMLELADEMPDSSPRFILLSYPLTLPSGRASVPYVLLYYLPENCNPSQRVSYAGAVELMRSTAEVNRVIEVGNSEDIEGIEGKLKGDT